MTNTGDIDSHFSKARFSVSEIIDSSKISAFHVKLVTICFFVMLFDGYDIQALSLAAPLISKSWHLQHGALGPVFSSALFGMMIGASILAPMGDKYGRNKIIILGLIGFGIAALATTICYNMENLLYVRFITGLFVGVAIPNSVGLVAEYTPLRSRATAVTVMFVGYTGGGLLSSITASYLMNSYGWPILFFVGGIIPLIIAVLAFFMLPRSIEYLLMKNHSEQNIFKILQKIKDIPFDLVDFSASLKKNKSVHVSVKSLFAEQRYLMTILLWVCFICSLYTIYFLISWLPTVIRNVGLSTDQTSIVMAWFAIGNMAGTIVSGKIIDRKSVQPFIAFFCLGGAAVVALGFIGKSEILLNLGVFFAGLFVVGSQGGLNAIASLAYPKAIVATGVGWALGVGRLGSIIGPLIGGLLLAAQIPSRTIFIIGAVPMLICALSCFLLVQNGKLNLNQQKVIQN